jgi:prevent-host-death family protein
MDEIGIERARHTLGEIVDKARFTGEPTAITRQGKRAVVVVGVQWFEQAADVIDMTLRAVGRGDLVLDGDWDALRSGTVHHLDGDSRNNDPANLEIRGEQ